MTKKSALAFILTVIAAVGVFAQSGFSINMGIGGYFTNDFGGGYEDSLGLIKGGLKTPYIGGGGFAFYDFTYVELNIGYFAVSHFWESYLDTGGIRPDSDYSDKHKLSGSGFDIGLLGKFPIAMSNKLSLFPLLGITYRMMLSVKDADGEYNNPEDLNALWFKIGGGLDYFLDSNLFLRTEVLYGIRLSNKFENDCIKAEKADTADSVIPIEIKSRLGHGLEIKLAVGVRL